MAILKAANLAVRFLLELCLLAAFGLWGFSVGGPLIVKIGLAVALVAVVAVVWGTFLSPKRTVRLADGERLLMEVALFGLGAAALAVTGRPVLAGALAVVYAINKLLIVAWKQG